MNFSRKKKFILWVVWIKETLTLWISGRKKRSFSTEEVGRKIFSEHLRNLHVLRTQEDDLSVLKKTIRWYFLSMEYLVYWLMKSSCFELSVEEKYGILLSQKNDGIMIFADYYEVLVLNFSEMGNRVFFEPKSWWKDDI